MTTERTTVALFQNNQEKELADILSREFADLVFNLIEEIEKTHDYVGLKHFRDRVLAPNIGHRVANLLLNKLINDNRLVVNTKTLETLPYPVVILEKPENIPS